ncbi:MAG: hypothetical protein RIC19_00800 [Phaeodactylibacter sp.]|uniref:hypothetical protein n=1 Tax=Phaeodactylibacter sp. TaxID=1940289 RepID=UPI0032EEDD31
MGAPNQAQLLLCALRHFDIAVKQSKDNVFLLSQGVQVSIEPDGAFVLWKKEQNLGRFSDVVRLCTALQEKAVVKG